MRFVQVISVVAVLVTLISCSKPSGSEPNSNSPLAPKGESSPRNGSTIGNGLTDYSNAKLGLNFQYPSQWSLIDRDGTVVLSNRPVATETTTSSISFALLSEIDGIHFTGTQSLETYLKTKFPLTQWLQTNLNNRKGFWSEVLLGEKRIADYYLLDENYNVFRIHLETFRDFQGEEVISTIIKALTLDGEGPVVKSVRFSKASAGANEQIELIIDAEDEISGLDVTRVGRNRAIPVKDWAVDRLGYHIEGASYFEYSMADAYSLVKQNFKQVSATQIRYTFTVPKNAPTGTIELRYLAIFDRKGNRTEINCASVSIKERSYCFGIENGNELPIPTFEVTPGTDADYFEDKEGPNFIETYFEKSFVRKSDKIQRLYIRTDDKSGLANYSTLQTTGEKRGDNSRYSSCIKWEGTLHQKSEGLYYIEGNIEGCFDHYGEGPNYNLMNLEELLLYDSVGNARKCTSHPYSKCLLKNVRFELIK